MAHTYDCPHCSGDGVVDVSGNNPSPYFETCSVCEGRRELTARQMLDYTLSQIQAHRNTAHIFNKNRALYYRHWQAAKDLLPIAHEARMKALEHEHAGAAHTARGLDHAA